MLLGLPKLDPLVNWVSGNTNMVLPLLHSGGYGWLEATRWKCVWASSSHHHSACSGNLSAMNANQ
eukprot:12882448-Prorocentrum_lima.AAC.1